MQSDSLYFPAVEESNKNGLLAFSRPPLKSEMLIDAFRHGIFPWPSDGMPAIPWFSPDPRAVVPLGDLPVSRRLQRTLRSERLSTGRFTISRNRDFSGVIKACASVGNRPREMWITPEMRRAYTQLHREGVAHSLEVWSEEGERSRLIGGIYGVAIGAFFGAESMFHHVRDASKVAFVHLCRHLRRQGYLLLDIQVLSPHTARLGAMEIPRNEYLARLHEALQRECRFDDCSGRDS